MAGAIGGALGALVDGDNLILHLTEQEQMREKLEELLAEGFMFPDKKQRAEAVAAADGCMVTAVSRQCKALAKEEAESLLAYESLLDYLRRDNGLKQIKNYYLQHDAEPAERKRKRVAEVCVLKKINSL